VIAPTTLNALDVPAEDAFLPGQGERHPAGLCLVDGAGLCLVDGAGLVVGVRREQGRDDAGGDAFYPVWCLLFRWSGPVRRPVRRR
jgi:hypothetical protein